MIRRIIAWLLGLPTLIVLLLFALANRHTVQISFDPVTPRQPWLAIELPLWMVLFGGILLGMLVGGAAAWVRQSGWRRLARRCQQQLELEKIARRRAEKQGATVPAGATSATSATTAPGGTMPKAPAAAPLPAGQASVEERPQAAPALPKS